MNTKNFVIGSVVSVGASAAALLLCIVPAPAPAQAQANAAVQAAPATLQTQAQQVYRWLDKNGKVVYSDQPPPADAKQPTAKRMGGSGADSEEMSYATAEAARKNPVVLFVNGCGEPCDKARKILSDRGVPHSTKNPELTKEIGDELKRLSGDMNVPFMVIGDAAMRGFEENAWNAALDNAGYPRAGVLTRKTRAKDLTPSTLASPAAAAPKATPNATPNTAPAPKA